MTEWHEPSLFVPMGLWDLVADGDLLRRAADPELMTALARAQEAMAPHVRSARPRSDHALYPESSAT
jgi:hypothetical protein